MRNKIFLNHVAHRLLLFIFLVLVLASFTTTVTASYPSQRASNNKCIDNERNALLHFKSYIYQDPEGVLSTWKLDEEDANTYCCNWSGVTCNNQTGHVTSLDLSFGDLVGKISPSLLNLSYLNHLDLSFNSFNGTIPMFIGSMNQLSYLNLQSNLFSGTIPVFIGSMTQLRYLNLGLNFFNGTIPSELGNLTNLQVLLLDSRSSCTLESLEWLSHLSQLEDLDMSGISFGKANNWVNVILSLQNLSNLRVEGCELSQVMHPYTYSSASSSFHSSIVTLSLVQNNLNSSLYDWLIPLTSNRLVYLDLSENELGGVPKYLGNFCNMAILFLENNALRGNFSDFLNNLHGCASSTLHMLYVKGNQFTGSLSNDIQNFLSLEYLDLSNNKLNGTISDQVWQLPKLKTLDVSSNLLKGGISENIEKSNITHVFLANNSLEGVPSEAKMSNLSSVEDIDLSSCKLGPHFPKWIQTMKNLASIDLSNTKISDAIPEDFWNTWSSRLKYLNISHNNITGVVTDMLSNFDSRASIIDLSSNNFYGRIPNAPSSLQSLDLSRNKFYGDIYFLCQIIDGSLFKYLDLSHNSFTGQIPDCLWHFTELKVLSLGHNNLSGRLPVSIQSLNSLEVLYVYNNSFSGELPSSLKNCTELTFLDLGANKFSGYVPVWIGEKLSKLYALSLTSNKFIGGIPLQLCQLVSLQILDLSMNKLGGTIPSCLNNLTYMVQRELRIDQNVHRFNTSRDGYVDHTMIKWQGHVRELSSTLKFLQIINLSSNNLTGKIPYELTELQNLNALDLSMNALLGEIPPNIGQMKELQILDLSRNSLSGGMPINMSHMTFLNYLNVSYNNLSGRIPSSTQLQSFEASSYIGNARLCGLPLSKHCLGDKEIEVPHVIDESGEDGEDTDDLQRFFYIGGASGFSIGFWMVCIALLFNRRWRHAFFHFLDCLKNWVYVKVMVFLAKKSKD